MMLKTKLCYQFRNAQIPEIISTQKWKKSKENDVGKDSGNKKEQDELLDTRNLLTNMALKLVMYNSKNSNEIMHNCREQQD